MRRVGAFLAIVIAAVGVYVLARSQRKPEAETTVALPSRTYSPATFDTVVWASEEAAIARGKDVFAWVCAKCHGKTGLGDGGEVIQGDTIHPPSFQAPGWRFADNAPGLYQRIHLGNNRGMPHWGEQGLQPRDVVGVATYIQKELRKDVQ